MPARLASDSSLLFAKNLLNFLTPQVNKDSKALDFKWDDDLVKGTLVTRDGAVVHPMLKKAEAEGGQ